MHPSICARSIGRKTSIPTRPLVKHVARRMLRTGMSNGNLDVCADANGNLHRANSDTNGNVQYVEVVM